ncbi:MAG: recombination mediator RecR, partial [Oscillospiraceae bacterium]
EFSEAIIAVHTQIKKCPVCQNFTDKELCPICSSQSRDKSIICIVESPRDVATFERTREYKGVYHVLHGLISPLDGIGAEQLTVKELLKRIGDGSVKEAIMATNPTVEGETTAMYISRLIKPFGIKVTRLAYGLPVGASLEFADEVTLFRALQGRIEM